MKSLRLFMFLFCAVCGVSVGVVSCEKNAESVEASEADDYEYVDDSNVLEDEAEPVEIEERGTSPFSITSIATQNFTSPQDFDGCETHKFENLAIPKIAAFTITGVGFGTEKNASTLECFSTADTSTKYTVNISNWSETAIDFTLSNIPDSLKIFKMKIRLKNPFVAKDSTASSPTKFVSKTKTRTIKCIGEDSNDYLYGENFWELSKQRALAGKTGPISFTGYTKIDTNSMGISNYTPKIGDILRNDEGKRAVIVSIGTIDKKNYLPVAIWQRNTICTGALKKGTWKFKTFFVPKKDGSTWTKFAY